MPCATQGSGALIHSVPTVGTLNCRYLGPR